MTNIPSAPQQRIRWTERQHDPTWRLSVADSSMAGARLEASMWVLLLLPFIGLLWVPFFNFTEPSLFGFPFFYWYQLAWVPISSLLIWLVYRSQTPDEAP
jgi:uncharacterized protein DUF3311